MGELLYGPNQVAEFPQAGPGYANDATAKNIPGRVIQYAGKKFRYVKFDNGSAVAPVAGGAAHWKTLAPETGDFVVTSDQTDALAGINSVAGTFDQAVVEDGNYTWIQVGGVDEDCIVNAGTPAGGKMIGSATDLTLDHIDVGSNVTDNVVGVALDAIDTEGTSRVLLQNLDW